MTKASVENVIGRFLTRNWYTVGAVAVGVVGIAVWVNTSIARVETLHAVDQAVTIEKFTNLDRFQEDAEKARVKVFDNFADIKQILGRIEGKLEKK